MAKMAMAGPILPMTSIRPFRPSRVTTHTRTIMPTLPVQLGRPKRSLMVEPAPPIMTIKEQKIKMMEK